MIGILIITHGDFADGIINSVEVILGKQENTRALGLYPGDSIDDFKEKVLHSIEQLSLKGDVLIFTDLFGASPYNAVALNKNNAKDIEFRCITGVNLPMLLEAFSSRTCLSINDIVEKCMKIGRDGIKELFNELQIANL